MIRLLRHAWKAIKASLCMPGDPCTWCGGELHFVPGEAGTQVVVRHDCGR
jgi:hypothetical protein